MRVDLIVICLLCTYTTYVRFCEIVVDVWNFARDKLKFSSLCKCIYRRLWVNQLYNISAIIIIIMMRSYKQQPLPDLLNQTMASTAK